VPRGDKPATQMREFERARERRMTMFQRLVQH
jgi:hypothetical protein